MATVGPPFEIEQVNLLEKHDGDGAYDIRLVGEMHGERVRLSARLRVADAERFYGREVAEWFAQEAGPAKPEPRPHRRS